MFFFQTLRQTQLSASDAYVEAHKKARSGISKPPSSKSRPAAVDLTKEVKAAFREIGNQLSLLYNPWPTWAVSGCWIAGEPTPGRITKTDAAGMEILSFVPVPLVTDFLSKTGQTLVSDPKF